MTVLRIRNSINLFKQNNMVRVVFMNSYQEVKLTCTPISMYMLKLLLNEVDDNSLYQRVKERFPEAVIGNLKRIIKKLLALKIIEYKQENEYADSFLDRQVNFYSDIVDNSVGMQKNLSTKRVLILGLGGAGSWIAYMLAQSGIQHFLLVDEDKVDATNLGRQALYFRDDIGNFKVNVISRRLKELNSQINVTTYKRQMYSSKDFDKLPYIPDIVINCADYPNEYLTGKIVTDYYLRLNVPMINGIGYRGNIISLGLTTIPGKTICWNCAKAQFASKSINFKPFFGNHAPQAGITGPIAAFIGSIHAKEAINILCPELKPMLTNRTGAIDFDSMTTSWQSLSGLERCEICKGSPKYD